MDFLKLIRYQNLLMLAFMQLLFRYGFLKLQNIPLALNEWQYALLVLSTVLIAAAGYVINNILDIQTDEDNKPKDVIVGKTISESSAYNIYIVLNCLGVAIGFYLSNVIDKPNFASLFIVIAATLYIYATSLKQMAIVGNLIVALILSVSVLIIGIFDLYPVITIENRQILGSLFSVLLDYAVFSFMINFIREIVKDLEDVNGDYNQGMKTLPIIIGVKRTSNLVFALSFIPIIALVFYIKTYLFAYNLFPTTLYTLVFILAPLFFFSVKIWTAKKQKDFNQLSNLLKWILFFGIFSILVLTLNIKYNA
ncbi:geranylgeranylglycerol-phosphate geranylgeranyltransferase [Flavobacterium sp. NG2]|uniref:geranylgeranylglycerol-phosphate geranylgeranyltransferase n=1 Tax=Flavobacterium sp. NG2 TaxID=3097547 RepID=UPI002A7F5B2D|nr:geranylgeranylglycerol-phosphate geranylgeranyltransferase [Flavobacterium sp. NG2]WPR70470.1 geranylgeranylglycerol-phosphate geranylgeranyltransferase [Flavobacterium sp. NG2]